MCYSRLLNIPGRIGDHVDFGSGSAKKGAAGIDADCRDGVSMRIAAL